MRNDHLTIKRLADDDYLVHYPCDLRSQSDKLQYVKTDENGNPKAPDEVPAIVRIGRAHAILDMLASGTYTSRKTVADALGCNITTVSRLLNFAFVSPEIIERFLAGEIPASKVASIAEEVHMMPFWADQSKQIETS